MNQQPGNGMAPGLFSPIHIGKVEVKNRIIMPAMILNYHLKGCELEEEWYEFYARAARGGAGLICCGATYTEMAGKQDEHQLGADSDDTAASALETSGAQNGATTTAARRGTAASIMGRLTLRIGNFIQSSPQHKLPHQPQGHF